MAHDAEAQSIPPGLQVEIYPGTEVMRDFEGSHFTHSHNDREGMVLVPQPSHSPDDPLNWSPTWKWIVVVIEVLFIMTSVITSLSVSPLTSVFEAQFNKDAEAIALLTGTLVIVTGYTNFILVPVAEVYGRRFILIVCSLICLGATIWHGAAQSYGSFMGARIFISIGMSISESLMPMVVSDVFFLHERGFYMGIYFFALFNSMFLGPLIAGACAQHFSTWRTFYWIITAFAAASFLSVIFLHPETKYIRHLPDVAPAASPRPSGEKNQIGQLEVPANTDSETSQTIDTDQYLGRGRPTKQQFRLIQAGDRDAMSKVSRHIITPFSLLQFPIVIFGAWMLAFSASGLLTLNYIQSGALTAPPYNFDDGQVGLSNLALVCGGTLGMFTAGPMSDWVANYQTKRNRGVREPEMRLVSMIPFVILSAIGMVVVGVGFDRKWPWEAVIVVGFGAVGLMTVSLSTIGITYAVDCYKPVSGQIMTIATVVKNTFGFGMGYYIIDWVADDGYIPPMMTQLGLVTGPAIFGIIFFSIFGKRLRKMSRHSKVHTY